jgi:low affinity Fe/Cu permease
MFRKIAQVCSDFFGRPTAFFLAIAVVIVWGSLGPIFDYSDTWQLVINTGTTIVTFLMVFLVQNTQNRDAKAIHLKLDELIRALGRARNDLLDIEDESDQRLKDLHQEFQVLSKKTKKVIDKAHLKESKNQK